MSLPYLSEIKKKVSLSDYSGISDGSYGSCPVAGCKGNSRGSKKVGIRGDRWTCYRCESFGDVVDWRAHKEGVELGEAARRFGVELGLENLRCPERAAILEAFVKAAHALLLASPDKASYLTQTRKIPMDVIVKLQLGYHDLENQALRDSGLSVEELAQVGLLQVTRGSEDNHYGFALMKGRFIFPYRSIDGEVLQIKGRLDPAVDLGPKAPKSLGLPAKADQAPAHWPSISPTQMLFCEHLIPEAQKLRKPAVLLAEGEPDVCSSWALGIPAVGMSGGSLSTRAQRLLVDSGLPLYDARDNDDVSEGKFKKDALDGLLSKPDRKWFRVVIPHLAGYDPTGGPVKVDFNDLVARFGWGKAQVLALVKQAEPAVDVLVRELASKFRTRGSVEKLAQLYKRTLIADKAQLLKKASAWSKVPEEILVFALDPIGWKPAKAPAPEPVVVHPGTRREGRAVLPKLFEKEGA